jgi:uncharacterized membrane protein (DUF485 family)
MQSERAHVANVDSVDWSAVIRDPRFQSLHRRKQRLLSGLMVFSVAYYFLLPVGAAYFQAVFAIKVWGVVNVGLLFALSEFVMAWAVAYYYAGHAGGQLDRLAAEISADFLAGPPGQGQARGPKP